ASEAPWRKGIRTGAVNSNVPVAVQQPQPSPQQVQQFPQPQQDSPTQTKTSTLQINLKSVKKPDAPPSTQPPQQSQAFEKPNQQPNILIPLKKPIPPSKGIPIPILIQQSTEPATKPSALKTTIPIQRPLNNDAPVIKAESKVKIITPQEEATSTTKKMPQSGPPAPPPPPGAPPPPPPLEGMTGKQAKIELLRKSSRKRPDWGCMMKEIEKGRALNKVQCNDRSKPMLSRLKSRGKFVYESEAKPASKKDALHNRILNEITQGVKLKKVHCDDRSRPNLSGLRVRRQSSVTDPELGGIPSQSLEAVEELIYFDIDVLRDELQSSKQMLQAEVESKQNLVKRTRDQKCQIIAMEAEIEELKAKLGIIPEDQVSMLAKSDSKTLKLLRKSGSNLWKSSSSVGLKKSKSGLAKDASLSSVAKDGGALNEEDLAEVNELDEEIVSLKEAVQHAKKQADEMEAKYKDATDKLTAVQNSFEDSEKQKKSMESKLELLEAQTRGERPILPIVQTAERTTQTEEQIIQEQSYSRQQSTASQEASESEEEESDMEVDENTVQKKKHERELILWENKLKSIKDKQNSSRTERRNLKNLQKTLEAELKDASKRHKKLQKEVDKMAKMIKDVEKDLDEDEEEEEEEEEGGGKAQEEKPEEETDEEEESEEEESESDSDDDDEESSEEDDEQAGYDDRLALFGKRAKRRENLLNALRKGNYLLRANIDRLKDELEDARIAYHDLEHELKAVLDET
ncbi:hypothetical protein Ocin01_04688, partial [Orchesella cincta]